MFQRSWNHQPVLILFLFKVIEPIDSFRSEAQAVLAMAFLAEWTTRTTAMDVYTVLPVTGLRICDVNIIRYL